MDLKFRTWWRPARKAGEPHDDRTVSFLELFYDLVYVVLVAELAHALAEHLDLKHILQFAFLFSIVWWSWLNGTTYHEYHGNNDIRTRILTFAQMFAVAGMAVFAHNAMGEGSFGFGLFYGIFQLILSYMWWRLAAHDPEHHKENRGFTIFFSLSTALFFISLLFPAPIRFYIWGVAVVLSLLQPLLQFMILPTVASQVNRGHLNISHALIERFGLFNILVLAEIIVGVVSGLSYQKEMTQTAFITGGLGLCIAFAMWWLYFDFVSHRKPIENRNTQGIWMYMHLFVSMSIVATGAIILYVVKHVGDGLEPTQRWALVGAVVVFLLSLFVLMRCVQLPKVIIPASRTASLIVLVVAVLIGALGLTSLTIAPLLAVIVVLMLFPVMYAVVFWVTVMSGGNN